MEAARLLGSLFRTPLWFSPLFKKRTPAKSTSRMAAPAGGSAASSARARATVLPVPSTGVVKDPIIFAASAQAVPRRANPAPVACDSTTRPARPQQAPGVVAPVRPAHSLALAAERVPAKPAPVAEAPVAVKKMRTLEEVRADLARLRETAKERHAQVQRPRDTSFAPTDFMDFADMGSKPADKDESGFAPTAFFDFGSALPSQRH